MDFARLPVLNSEKHRMTVYAATEMLKTNKIYQEVYNSQTQGGGDFDKQGGEQ